MPNLEVQCKNDSIGVTEANKKNLTLAASVLRNLTLTPPKNLTLQFRHPAWRLVHITQLS